MQFAITEREEMEETWKKLNGYDGYWISSIGRIKSPKGNIIKGSKIKSVYIVVSLKAEHKAKIALANKNNKGCGWRRKPIVCVKTGVKYESQLEAERNTGICSSSIGGVCLGKRKTAGGFHLGFVN